MCETGRVGAMRPPGVGIIAKDPGIAETLVRDSAPFLTQRPDLAQ
jgi:hypothetical protein